MGARGRFLLAGVAAAAALWAAPAAAEPLDPSLERLVIDPNCVNADGSFNDAPGPVPGPFTGRRTSCTPDSGAFKKLIAQWGFAIAPTAMHTARTTGLGGFHFALEAAYTDIDQGRDYWTKGTQGKRDVSTGAAKKRGKPGETLNTYSLKARKSFGFGLETTMALGFVQESSIITGGADVRLSLLEGFRAGLPGILPDVAAGGGVRTITGTPQFQLTVASLDVQVSKPFPIADSQVLTPWVGFQYLWIFGDSGLIDLTPGTDPLGYCQYTGQNLPGNPDPRKPNLYDGQPVCRGGSPVDFNNNVVFDQARLERQRLMVGLNYRYEMVSFGAQWATDIVDPEDAQTGSETTRVYDASGNEKRVKDKKLLEGMPKQWTLSFELGVMF